MGVVYSVLVDPYECECVCVCAVDSFIENPVMCENGVKPTVETIRSNVFIEPGNKEKN